MTDVQSYSEEKAKQVKQENEALGIRKISVFVEEGLAWGNWQEASR